MPIVLVYFGLKQKTFVPFFLVKSVKCMYIQDLFSVQHYARLHDIMQ